MSELGVCCGGVVYAGCAQRRLCACQCQTMPSFPQQLADLDDYLAPSLECIKPELDAKKAGTAAAAAGKKRGTMEMEDEKEEKKDVNSPAIQIEMEVPISLLLHLSLLLCERARFSRVCTTTLTTATTIKLQPTSTKGTHNSPGRHRHGCY